MNDEAQIKETTEQKEAKGPSKQSPYEQLLADLSLRNLPEEKIQLALLFMEGALAKEAAVDFKGFWEARKICLTLFREPIAPLLRGELWNKFSDLSKEARRLKDISDEQSAFAAEQIEMAIQSIENDLSDPEKVIATLEVLSVPQKCRALAQNWDDYSSMQRELNFLNAYASRINGLRKELMKTDMRIRIKNQLFDRLSKAGDLLFPRRKELIHLVSERFEKDVHQFTERHFGPSGSSVPTFALREEIKEMQGVAKLLTLNAKAFNQVRMKLSACWDALKEKDVEKKKELEGKKELFQTNAEPFYTLFSELEGLLSQEGANADEMESRLSKALQEMRNVELGRDDVRQLKEKAQAVRKTLFDREHALEKARKEAEAERQTKRRALIEELRVKAAEILTRADSQTIEEVNASEEAFKTELAASGLNRTEQTEIEKLLKPLKAVIKRKKEEALLNLPKDAREALEQLRELLAQKQQEKIEIKSLLEDLRKKSKASGLDFNRALEFNEKITEENERLQEVVRSVDEIEARIEGLEEQVE